MKTNNAGEFNPCRAEVAISILIQLKLELLTQLPTSTSNEDIWILKDFYRKVCGMIRLGL